MKIRWMLLVALCVAPAPAAALSAQAMLRKIDAAINPFRDRRFKIRMTIRDADGTSREVEVRIAERKARQRLMIFTAPADVKGMGVLAQDRTTLYVYLPSYHRVRRVAMHARKQSFLGSHYTFDDMAQLRYAPDYRAKVLRNERDKVVLELTPKEGRDLPYSKLVVTADTRTWLLDRLEYYDAEGRLAKTETRGDYRMVGNAKIQASLEMVDERTRGSTRIEVVEHEVNVGLPRRLFTKRGLIRGKL